MSKSFGQHPGHQFRLGVSFIPRIVTYAGIFGVTHVAASSFEGLVQFPRTFRSYPLPFAKNCNTRVGGDRSQGVIVWIEPNNYAGIA
jgi:hypothetical protein